MGSSRRSARVLAALVGAIALGVPLATSAAASAAEGPDPTITWSVSPADPRGPDGRSWVELTVDPGDSMTEYVAIRNLSEVDAEFKVAAADGYLTETGRFNMLPSTEESTAAGTWIDVQESVQIEAGTTAVIPFIVNVPIDATPGDHPAGVAASVLSVSTDSSSARVGVESRVGFRVMIRVSGELRPSIVVSSFSAAYELNWNPFQPGLLLAEFTVENDGNARLSVWRETLSSPPGLELIESEALGELFPGDRRTFTAQVDGVWPMGLVAAELLLQGEVVGVDQLATAEPVTSRVSAWALPIPQLGVLGLIVLLYFGLRARRRRRLRAIDAMLTQARADGYREARSAASHASET
jgi:hypothetical protein